MAELILGHFYIRLDHFFNLKENLLLALVFADIRLYRLAMALTHRHCEGSKLINKSYGRRRGS